MICLVDGKPRELCEIQLNRLRAAGMKVELASVERRAGLTFLKAGGKCYVWDKVTCKETVCEHQGTDK